MNEQPYNTIVIKHRQFQMDRHTFVTVRDHNGKIHEEHFEEEEKADQYTANFPSDYIIKDFRLA